MTTVLRLFVTLLEGESEGEVYRHRFVRPSVTEPWPANNFKTTVAI